MEVEQPAEEPDVEPQVFTPLWQGLRARLGGVELAESSASSRCFNALPDSRSGELDLAFPRQDDTHRRVREETYQRPAILIG